MDHAVCFIGFVETLTSSFGGLLARGMCHDKLHEWGALRFCIMALAIGKAGKSVTLLGHDWMPDVGHAVGCPVDIHATLSTLLQPS